MKRNTAQLKEQFIQTGIDEIGKHGIEQLSLRTVAKACGVTHGSPYRHFESKEGYLKVVLTQLSLFLNQEINENIDATGPAREQRQPSCADAGCLPPRQSRQILRVIS